MKQATIRIVGGEYRRTPITVPKIAGLRPTPDRIRETLFNWLHHFWGDDIQTKQVLDLFAGSGILGFEAASRGAASVLMVESNPIAVRALRAVKDRLKPNNLHIHAGDAIQFIKRLEPASFDLVFLDPPFSQNWLPRLWTVLLPLLKPQALVYIESETDILLPPELLSLRTTRAGQVHVCLAKFDAMQNKVDNPTIQMSKPIL